MVGLNIFDFYVSGVTRTRFIRIYVYNLAIQLSTFVITFTCSKCNTVVAIVFLRAENCTTVITGTHTRT